MNFQEKSAWACLLSMLGIYTPYFLLVLREPLAGPGLFVAAAIAVMSWILITGFGVLVSAGPTGAAVPLDTALAAVNWLFAGFVFANVVYYGAIVVGHRRLAFA